MEEGEEGEEEAGRVQEGAGAASGEDEARGCRRATDPVACSRADANATDAQDKSDHSSQERRNRSTDSAAAHEQTELT